MCNTCGKQKCCCYKKVSSRGLPGKKGDPGKNGLPGVDGRSVVSIDWTSNSGGQPQGTVGTTDTYTITYSTGPTSNYIVANGNDGAPGSPGPAGSMNVAINHVAANQSLLTAGFVTSGILPATSNGNYMVQTEMNVDTDDAPLSMTFTIRKNGVAAILSQRTILLPAGMKTTLSYLTYLPGLLTTDGLDFHCQITSAGTNAKLLNAVNALIKV